MLGVNRNERFKLSLRVKENIAAYSLLIPAIVFFLLFHYYPIISAFAMSFFDYSIVEAKHSFLGLGNYAALAQDGDFLRSFANTAYYVAGTLVVGIVLALLFASMFNVETPFAEFYRTLFFIPVVTSMVAASLVWQYIYQPNIGLLNRVLKPLGIGPFAWLLDAKLAMPSVIVVGIWKKLGFNVVIFLSGLKSIPEIYYDAAMIDGANRWQKFTRITLPLLRPITLFVFITTAIDSFQVFTQVFVMTSGGPVGATNTLVFSIYTEGFRFDRLGSACAMTFVMFAVILIFTIVQMKMTKTDSYD
jgi:ABC-type sugar transport system permease subunit